MRLAVGLLAVTVLAVGCGDTERTVGAASAPSGPPTLSATMPPAVTVDDTSRPNIVFVLTDDLSTDLLRFMPHVRALERAGTSFDDYFVSDSLCCPSRATIFTGRLPHNTGVYTNYYPNGGAFAFRANDNPRRSFAVALRRLGYHTALMGKYLNGYRAQFDGMPPGWTDWAGSDAGYFGFDYTLNVDGFPTYFGSKPRNYLTDVLSRRGARFIGTTARRRQPFFLELATFAPHRPAVPAPRDRNRFPHLRAPRTPAFNRAVVNAPPWLRNRPFWGRPLRHEVDRRYRKRARSVLAIDKLLGRVLTRLRATGELANTYVVFSSDNGFHMGEHRLQPGKLTAFDTDVRVPLIVAGPGVLAGAHTSALTQNTDLAPTFEELAGGLPDPLADGRSLVSILDSGRTPADWRGGALIEHRNTAHSPEDPDDQTKASGDPPTYKAVRTPGATYVEYRDGEREYYDDRLDPAQLRNAYGDLSFARRRALHRQLRQLVRCSGAAQCATTPASPAAPAVRTGRPVPLR